MGSEPLQPALDDAQKALVTALEEACAADLSRLNTEKLVRIEETLAEASKAARKAISVQRQVDRQQAPTSEKPTSRGAQPATDRADTTQHRVFADVRGKQWHAFAVQSSSTTTSRSGLPESFRNGWLVFDSPDEVRRVAPVPDGWVELPVDKLRHLCQKAVGAPKRASSTDETRSDRSQQESRTSGATG
jgi:hypothetical protein